MTQTSSTADQAPANLARAKRNVLVLIAAQAILGSQITMIFVIGGLAGQLLAPHPCLATLPLSLIVFGSMTTAPWLSTVMQKYGRRTGFLIGTMGGTLGAIIAGFGLLTDNFWLFVLGSYGTGIYMSAQAFYRFAATDTAPAEYKAKAISYVLAGGLLSAIIGPQLVSFLTQGSGDSTASQFVIVYVAAVLINLIGLVLFFLLDIPKPEKTTQLTGGRSLGELIRTPRIATAIIVAMVSYSLMNLVMTSTPLAVVGCGYLTSDASNVVTAHVLAMFAPSFFTGHLIQRFGVERIMAVGLTILAGAGVVALMGVTLTNFFIALVLLGLGWNFGFIGATAMLTSSHTEAERGRIQGLNDAIVFTGVTFASLASGGLMNCAGGNVIEGWNAVNLAMGPFLLIAGGALVWLARQPKSTPA
ncbi:MAG: MFS transporter [Pseudomonadota bacterium]